MTANTKEIQILETGELLFNKYGLRRVTVEEICQTAGVSKMTFYKYFPNKVDLAKCIIQNLTDDAEQRFNKTMRLAIPFTEKVHLIIEQKIEDNERIGEEFYGDLTGSVPELLDFLQGIGRQAYKRMLDIFKEAQEKGDIRKEIPMEFILYSLNSILDKINDPQLAGIFKDRKEMIEIMTENFFFGIAEKHTDA